MKSKVICVIVATVLTCSLTACSQKDPENTASVSSAVELNGLQDKEHSVYIGKLNDQDVYLDIYRLGDTLEVVSLCKNSTEETHWSGSCQEDTISLTQEGKSDKITGSKVKDDVISLSIDNNTMNLFKLHHVVKSESAKIRYPGYENQEVEAFSELLKKDICSGDKKELSQLIDYPLTISHDGKQSVLKDEKEFLKQFNSIFTDSYRDKMQDTYTKFMNSSNKGVTLPAGFGYIRFNKVDDGSLKVIKIVY